MNILIAPDKFKGCLDAPAAAAALAAAAKRVYPEANITTLPMSDGGDGFAALLGAHFGAETHVATVRDAYGAPRAVSYAMIDAARLPSTTREHPGLHAQGKIALLDAASACGLAGIPDDGLAPWEASSRGVGELVAQATERGAGAIVLGLGGVATNDLGLGALCALGLEISDTRRGRLQDVAPLHLHKDVRFGGYLWPHIPEIILACDVTHPLLGPSGATFAFGRQKGLLSVDLNPMEKLLGALAKKLCDHTEKPRTLISEPGTGAAGGLGFAFRAAFDARIVPGARFVAECFALEKRIREADLVITGEGAFDVSSLGGKAPGLVLAHADAARKPVCLLAGRTDLAATEALRTRHPRARAFAISHPDWTLAEATHHFTAAAELALRAYADATGR